jgi:diguanylate cyclase (GGDEF)-like protein
VIDRLRRDNKTLRTEIASLRQENDRLRVYEELAYHDDLTGLHNRRYFEQRVAQELSRAERTNKQLAIAIIDLDDFKRINDVAGHAAGDRVLSFVGRYLASCCRGFDIACRIGGDEFALIIPETDAEGARAALERIEARFQAAVDRPRLSARLAVSFSFGLALFPTDAHTIDNLLARADHAMYLRKTQRKLRVPSST